MPRNYYDQAKISEDFGWLDNAGQNSQAYQELADQELVDVASDAKLPLTPGYRLLRSDINSDTFALVMLCDTTQEIVYFIRCQIWDDVVLNDRPVTQVLLWRTNVVSHRRVTSGIAEDIFRNYLLESYNIIASDSCQTREGRDFWVRQIGYALAFNEFVYRYHRVSCKLTPITDHAVVRDNSCDLWGDSQDYENVLAVISKDPITH